jgi:hypothetical protein
MTKCANSECTKLGVHLCGGCKGVRYCSAACQKVHWKQARWPLATSKSARPPQMPQAEAMLTPTARWPRACPHGRYPSSKSFSSSLARQARGVSRRQTSCTELLVQLNGTAGVSTAQWSGHCRLVPLPRATPSPVARYRVARARLHTRISFTRALISLPRIALFVPQLLQPCLLCTLLLGMGVSPPPPPPRTHRTCAPRR